jgi:hypothetical protein
MVSVLRIPRNHALKCQKKFCAGESAITLPTTAATFLAVNCFEFSKNVFNNCKISNIFLSGRLPERLAFTDVSSYAGAGYVVHFSYTSNIVHRMWTNEERLKSSTWRELKATLLK